MGNCCCRSHRTSRARHPSFQRPKSPVFQVSTNPIFDHADYPSDYYDYDQRYNLPLPPLRPKEPGSDIDKPLWVPSTPYSSASFVVTNKTSTIEWKGHGLKIHVLDDSIPLYLTEARLDVSVHGFKYIDSLPLSADDWSSSKDNPAHPVSALYSINVGSGKLCKPVTIEIQHCLPRVIIPHSMILRAASEKECFKPIIEDVVFDLRANYGRVTAPCNNKNQEYDDFSWFIIALRQLLLPNTIHYKAQVYISKTTMKMHFIITMAIDPCTTVCSRRVRLCMVVGTN